jgi:geranylgeranyl reductase family protein
VLSSSYDVIVVGGGPAGSCCAGRAADLGLSVLVLDRSEFPRPKPCAAGLTDKALALLGRGRLAFEHRRFRVAEIAFANHLSLIVESEAPLVVTTTREELDDHLLRDADGAGAEVREGQAAEGIEEGPDGVVVRCGRDVLKSDYVVVADGAQGPGRRMLGLAQLRMGGALYVRLRPKSGELSDEHAGRLLFDPTITRRGYGWVFPKRDHLNVGVFTQRRLGVGLKDDLAAFIEARGLQGWLSEGPFAFPISVARPHDALGTKQVLFAGDAAGLANPITGEGISSAIASGRIAGESIAAGEGGASAEYARRIEVEVIPTIDGYRRRGDLAYGLAPWLVRALARTPLVRAAIVPAWRAATRSDGSLSIRAVVPEHGRRASGK